MLKRHLLLIASQRCPEPQLHAPPNISLWEAFLTSDNGGAWQSQEIIRAENWDRERILEAVQSASKADYSVLIYSGKGENVRTERPWPELRLSLNNGESLTERELNSGSPRCTLIFDCSEGYAPASVPLIVWRNSSPSKDGHTLTAHRLAYDQAVMAAEGGLIKVYAKAPSQPSLGHASFSQHILSQTAQWVTNHEGLLFLKEGVALAAATTIASPSESQPEYLGGRRLHDFPFAVALQ